MTKQIQSCLPEVRFGGCGGEWTEQVLDDVVDFYSGLTYSPLDVVKVPGTLVLRSSNVKNGEVVDADNVYVDPSAVNSKNVEEGDLIVVVRNGSRALIGKHAQIKHSMENTVIGAFMTGIESEQPHFINALLDTHQFRKEVEKNLGATINQITTGAFKKMRFVIPSDPAEQSLIGQHFAKLDEMISQHQRKHAKLVALKKAMLQKLFPRDGARTPEIRFKGFLGDWELRPLHEVSDKVLEKNVSREFSETFTNSAEFGVISQRDYFDKDITNAANIGGYYIVRPEDFVYNPRISSYAPVGPVKRNKLGRTGVMSPLYTVFRIREMDTVFLEYFFETSVWHPFMFSNGDTGARADRFSIKDTVFFELPIPSPQIDEQRKIGEYFSSLSELIQKHATQITKLRNIKAVCLEKMFV